MTAFHHTQYARASEATLAAAPRAIDLVSASALAMRYLEAGCARGKVVLEVATS